MDCTVGASDSLPILQYGTSSTTPASLGAGNRQLNKQKTFALNYTGHLHVIVSSTENKNIGNLHPVKLGKLFIKHFKGVTNIAPIGSHRVKITFDSIINANSCLSSTWLSENGFSATIPSSLIYSFGVIHLDPCVSVEDFREGLECHYKGIEHRRITIKRDNIIVPTKLVKIKFLSPILPINLRIFKVNHNVFPSIRPPVQCIRCLRFGHTQKFCRSKPRCSPCGKLNHNIDTCKIC